MLNDNNGLFKPKIISGSGRWNYWRTIIDGKQCRTCFTQHGTIYNIREKADPNPPAHNNCRCEILSLDAVMAGEATLLGAEGADWYLMYHGELPDYYITKNEALLLGWKSRLGNLGLVAPNKYIGGDVYDNPDGKLPSAQGRIWYEADINYNGSYRGAHRIMYSNDGLMFATYDLYKTFLEII